MVGAIGSVTVWWMSGAGGQREPAEVSALFLRLAQPGLELALATPA